MGKDSGKILSCMWGRVRACLKGPSKRRTTHSVPGLYDFFSQSCDHLNIEISQ